jgi:uncharacterized membrane protein YebE (DUF533 family)
MTRGLWFALSNPREGVMTDTKPSYGRDVWMALAAIGWADGALDPEEADAIVRTALDEGIELDEIAEIEEATKNPIDIGDIDLSRLTKEDRLFIFAVASWLARIDGEVTEGERKALTKLGETLKIPEKPQQHAEHIAWEVAQSSDGLRPAFYNLPKIKELIRERLAEAKRLKEEAGKSSDGDASET